MGPKREWTNRDTGPRLLGPRDRRLYALGQALAGSLIGAQMAMSVGDRHHVLISLGFFVAVLVLQYFVRAQVWTVPRHTTKLIYGGMAASMTIGLLVILPVLRNQAQSNELSAVIILAGMIGIAAPSWGTAAMIARGRP